jgi:hypothetical protein
MALASFLSGRVELAEAAEDIVGFEVEAFDFVIGPTTFNGRPVDDGCGSGTHGIAHVGLLEDFVGTGASAAVSEELIARKAGALDAIDDIEEAKFDGIRDGDAVVEVPRGVEG